MDPLTRLKDYLDQIDPVIQEHRAQIYLCDQDLMEVETPHQDFKDMIHQQLKAAIFSNNQTSDYLYPNKKIILEFKS